MPKRNLNKWAGAHVTIIKKHHYVLAVPDAARTAVFFVRQLGFEVLPVDDPGWCFVSRDGLMIMLGSCPDAIKPADLGDHSYFAYFVVDDVDEFYQEVMLRGVAIRNPPESKPWGMREFGIKTPDGHRIMVGQELRG
jgi:catechol 2,3-dioxygenase-like lactoylglutathione lyase family enzyme